MNKRITGYFVAFSVIPCIITNNSLLFRYFSYPVETSIGYEFRKPSDKTQPCQIPSLAICSQKSPSSGSESVYEELKTLPSVREVLTEFTLGQDVFSSKGSSSASVESKADRFMKSDQICYSFLIYEKESTVSRGYDNYPSSTATQRRQTESGRSGDEEGTNGRRGGEERNSRNPKRGVNRSNERSAPLMASSSSSYSYRIKVNLEPIRKISSEPPTIQLQTGPGVFENDSFLNEIFFSDMKSPKGLLGMIPGVKTIRITFQKYVAMLLPYPYETSCKVYSSQSSKGKEFNECLMTSGNNDGSYGTGDKNEGKIPPETIVADPDTNSNMRSLKYFYSTDQVDNERITSRCHSLVYHPDCQSEYLIPIIEYVTQDRSESSSTEAMVEVFPSIGYPVVKIMYSPSLTFGTMVTLIFISNYFWLGITPFFIIRKLDKFVNKRLHKMKRTDAEPEESTNNNPTGPMAYAFIRRATPANGPSGVNDHTTQARSHNSVPISVVNEEPERCESRIQI